MRLVCESLGHKAKVQLEDEKYRTIWNFVWSQVNSRLREAQSRRVGVLKKLDLKLREIKGLENTKESLKRGA